MKLLAIDTSTDKASVALMLNEEILSKEQGSQKTHAQFLLTMIDELMTEAALSMSQLDAIVFGCGPGSFTGLRIACSIAKGLAHPHDLGLIPVSTLGSIAYEARQQKIHDNSAILAVMDARMQQMYWSYFGKNQWFADEKVNAVEDLRLPLEDPLVIAGVGIDLYWTNFPDRIKSQIKAKLNVYPNAATMLKLVLAAGLTPISAAQAQPVYVRNQVTSK